MEKKNKPAINKIMDTIDYILDHIYFPTIKENTPFFFGVDFDEKLVNYRRMIFNYSAIMIVFIKWILLLIPHD